jgi:hypothetical protein
MAKDEIYTDDELASFDMQAEPEVVAKKGIGEKIGDVIFNLMRRKKHEKKKEPTRANNLDNNLFEDTTVEIKGASDIIPEDVVIPNPLPLKQSKKRQLEITGFALIAFAAGTIILYTQLPTHPALIIGIVIVIISGHILLTYNTR